MSDCAVHYIASSTHISDGTLEKYRTSNISVSRYVGIQNRRKSSLRREEPVKRPAGLRDGRSRRCSRVSVSVVAVEIGEPMEMFEGRDILCVHPRREFSPPWELREISEGRGQTVRVNREI